MQIGLDLIAATAIAVLSGMGVGSGGLLVIYLTLIRDVPQLSAQGINLLFYLCSAGGSLAVHLRRRHLRFPLIALLAGAGLVGAYLGSSLSSRLDPALLRRLFGGMLLISGSIVLAQREKQPHPH
ncbi:MAG: sulfite exporter TauE/SafE family protein [Clostridia bacterium]|nr:sulfite exporter TauE/SafE family protein [Clostridia bacterium]